MATTSILFSISRGKRPRHIFALIYDTDGVGKSTFCSHAPNDKMHVLLIGHTQIKSFQDPELPAAYDRYQLKINDKAAALVREAADAVLFARFETELIRDNGSKPRARGEGNRIMYAESRAIRYPAVRFGSIP